MALPSIIMSNTEVELVDAPIEPSWIVEGNPVARNAVLSNSRDRTAYTLIWDCTPGKFVWHYDTDETIHILEGLIVLDDGNGPPRRLGPGEVVFFPAGAKVLWHVEQSVRKLAFFRRHVPAPLAAIVLGLGKVKRLVKRPSEAAGRTVERAGQRVARSRST